jgi:hypothetical protein
VHRLELRAKGATVAGWHLDDRPCRRQRLHPKVDRSKLQANCNHEGFRWGLSHQVAAASFGTCELGANCVATHTEVVSAPHTLSNYYKLCRRHGVTIYRTLC